LTLNDLNNKHVGVLAEANGYIFRSEMDTSLKLVVDPELIDLSWSSSDRMSPGWAHHEEAPTRNSRGDENVQIVQLDDRKHLREVTQHDTVWREILNSETHLEKPGIIVE